MENVVIDAPAKLGRIVVGMNKVLGEIPVTVKLRTGVKEGKNTAHKLMPRVADWGASCLTVRHYSSLFESFFLLMFDSYMGELDNNVTPVSQTGTTSGSVLKQSEPRRKKKIVRGSFGIIFPLLTVVQVCPIPIFGGGDCFSAQDYYEKLECGKVDGIMVGRGALIKPWIFTEIKERREWDISARERLDLIRDVSRI